jgi:hypothetical protein
MKPNPVVILHGWNDTSESFKPLANWLRTQGFNVVPIWLGDYLSLNDEITLKDLGTAFQRALRDNAVPQTPHAFDVIVHSTGGLVIREYLRQYFAEAPGTTPVQNLLMFSPANLGSPLAAMGKSVLGRLFDGWGWDHLGQTGQAILNALDMASPYSWDLAGADLLDPANAVFAPQNTLVTVIVGTAAYPGIKSVVHQDGGDGTVLVSTANLNVSKLTLDCAAPDPITTTLIPLNCPALALAVLNRDHTDIHDPTISDPNDPTVAGDWARLVLAALNSSPTNYAAQVNDCAQVSQRTFAAGLLGPNPDRYHQYQLLVVHVHDQFGDPVPDYVVEFYQEANDATDAVFTEIHGNILVKVTTNSVDPSYRSFLFDTNLLNDFLAANPNAQIEMSVSAASVSARIYYRNPSRGIALFTGAARGLLLPNAALLVDVTLYRDSIPDIFKLTPAV